ncbi:hypothetical protein MP638_001104 [Amoeboaphelidium occidentale]|nr:hypothetical protein MP638_001104 [Amoeboaphelidium occidentale]
MNWLSNFMASAGTLNVNDSCHLFTQLGLDIEERRKYAPLTEYFGSLSISDLEAFDLELLAENQDKAQSDATEIFQRARLSGNNNFISSVNEEKDDIHGRVNIRQLPALCEKYVKEPLGMVDLSNNNLRSSDLIIIRDVLLELHRRKLLREGCQVDISNNRIHGIEKPFDTEVPQAIREICQIPETRYLVLRTNPFCTVDRIDFFQSLTLNDLEFAQKFIWLDSFAVVIDHWKKLLGNDELVKITESAHRKFYGMK